MRIFTKKFAAIAAASVGMALTSSGAWALLVDTWSYSTNATFIAPTTFLGNGNAGTQVGPTPFVGSTPTPASNASCPAGGPCYELSWGYVTGNFQSPVSNSDFNRSALTIGQNSTTFRTGGGPVTGSVNTTIGGFPNPLLGQVGVGTTLTHWNNPIAGTFRTLTSGVVHDTLTLTGNLPNPPYPGATVALTPIDFSFEFRETDNGGPCAGGTTPPCGDLWGIVGTPNLDVPFTYQDPVSLVFENYLASIFVLGLGDTPVFFGNLLPGECTALGLGSQVGGCQGFRTAESAVTTVRFGFAITTEPIITTTPEPGSLALFAIALAALGFSTRRKQS